MGLREDHQDKGETNTTEPLSSRFRFGGAAGGVHYGGTCSDPDQDFVDMELSVASKPLKDVYTDIYGVVGMPAQVAGEKLPEFSSREEEKAYCYDFIVMRLL